jgi:hypothetical protein
LTLPFWPIATVIPVASRSNRCPHEPPHHQDMNAQLIS